MFFLAVPILVMLTFQIPIICFFKAIKEPVLSLASVVVAKWEGEFREPSAGAAAS